ncbi:tryptophan 2,3-dioxygenase (plasmid) [Saprospira grandis str. Lewin]|uniref:Tryptophan 2,3-dioxygenase n=2 Tax=Saprospira TaxID=1007 RepID=H6LAZ8_SAPGL|nr:tryptophan 2,3-dioxygenase [Saprospira grandis str. Lewin]
MLVENFDLELESCLKLPKVAGNAAESRTKTATMKNSYTGKEQYYNDYLGLDKILSAQQLESEAQGVDAHDEMLFIIVHQAYELWFKQVQHELSSILKIFDEQYINDNSKGLQVATHRLNRVVEIWKLLVAQVRVMETMTPMDFLDFRDLLTPASGFQSFQFRLIETRLGLKMDHRHAKKYYEKQLRAEHIEAIKAAENSLSLFELLDNWLARMPFWQLDYWQNFEQKAGENAEMHPFWAHYRGIYLAGLKGSERSEISMKAFDELFFAQENRPVRLSEKACRSALFIYLYREYPLLQQPFQLLNKLLELDELMSTFRYRHMIMVRRMIGMRAGTGGSSGAGYLEGAMNKHHIFGDLASLATYLIPRNLLPELDQKLVKDLSFRL